MQLSEIPGYNAACRRADRLEDAWRDFAFLGLDHEIRPAGSSAPVELQQLTLRMFIQLCAVRSPFMVGGSIGPEDVALILWRLSPKYAPGNREVRAEFVASIAALPFKSTVRAITRFLDRMLIDKPPSRGKANDSKADTSFAAALVHNLASAYGWSDDQILDLPMPRLFQYLRNIQRMQSTDIPRFNPLRDRLTKKIVDKALEARKAARQNEQNLQNHSVNSVEKSEQE